METSNEANRCPIKGAVCRFDLGYFDPTPNCFVSVLMTGLHTDIYPLIFVVLSYHAHENNENDVVFTENENVGKPVSKLGRFENTTYLISYKQTVLTDLYKA